MFQQFPDVLGMRTQDPMLVTQGLDPLLRTEQAMLDQGAEATARIAIEGRPTMADGTLTAQVRVENLAGHKLPSGVGFRRAFIAFEVLDAGGTVLWASGRTNGAGVIVGAAGQPVAGELWWQDDCSARIDPQARLHQPHYQVVSRQDQAQIYQELASVPPTAGPPRCGHDAPAEGALTTSFLSICAEVKDNRILPHGYLDLAARKEIARALGAGADLAEGCGSNRHRGRSGLSPRRHRQSELPGRTVRASGRAEYGQGDAVLSGHPALFSPGPLLHRQGHRYRPAALPDRILGPERHAVGRLET